MAAPDDPTLQSYRVDEIIVADTVTATYTGIVHQDGVSSFGAWVEILDSLQPLGGAGAGIGIIYQFSLDSGLIVEPSSLDFRIFPSGGANGVESSVYILNEYDPANYSVTLLPGTRGETVPAQLVCEVTGDYRQGDFTWAAAGGSLFSYQLGRRWANGAWVDDATLKANWRRYLYTRQRRSEWSGKIAFTILSSANPNVPFYSSSKEVNPSLRPTITVTQWQFHTGHLNFPESNGRSIHCGRSGLPFGANQLVEDGWTPGLYVRAESWDDKDRAQEAELPDTEGKVFDKVTT